MIIFKQLKPKGLHIFAKIKNSDIVLFFPICAFPLISTSTHYIFSFLAFDTLELELSLVLFFALWFMCSEKKEKKREMSIVLL